jgi:pantetheine-phosphate adenylyltransferase
LLAAIFPGTFDPPTWGHLQTLDAAARVFDRVYWALAINHQKQPMFTARARLEMMEILAEPRPKVMVIRADTAIVDECVVWNVEHIVRSFRMTSDFESELQMAMVNKKLSSRIDTVFFPPTPETIYVSSTIARQLITLQLPLDDYVPPTILKVIRDPDNYTVKEKLQP